MLRAARAALVPAVLFALVASAQGPKVVPDRLTAFELPDQYGVSHRVDGSVRVLLLSRDMDGGAVVRGALERQGDAAAAFLATRGAVYVADVSRMPALVRRLLAIPRMKSRPYSVLLDTAGEATAALPSEKGRASVLWLEDLRPVRVELLDSPDALLERLGEPPSAPGS